MSRSKTGWIKLYRSAVNEDIGSDGVVLAVWVTLLSWANYQTSKEKVGKQQIILEPGMFFMGISDLAKRLRFPKTTIYRALQYLEKTERIFVKSGTLGTIVTICNWKEYQDNDATRETQMERRWNADGTQVEHDATHSKERRIKELKKEEKDSWGISDETPRIPETVFSESETQNPKPLREEKKKNSSVAIRQEYSKAFDDAWKSYNRKGEKKAAYTEYQKLKLDEGGIQDLGKAIVNYCKSQPEEKFRKDFERFLKSDWREWLDERQAQSNGIDWGSVWGEIDNEQTTF